MNRSPEVFVVIPVHNRRNHTVECLKALEEQSYSPLTVIVVDDGSTDNTEQTVRTYHPEVVILKGDGDLWWTGATNLGVEWALHRCCSSDFILTLNNDTVVGPEYITFLVNLAQYSQPSIIGSVAVDSRNGQTIVDGGTNVSWWSAKWTSMNHGRRLEDCLREGTTFVEPDCLSGRGTLIPVRCLHEVGLFDAKRLPHYGADYEFSVRAAKAGYQLVMSYEAPVLSDVATTGLSVKRQLSWGQFGRAFFSRRSPSCLLYRWRFARLTAPRRTLAAFLAMDTVRVAGGAVRDQVAGGRE